MGWHTLPYHEGTTGWSHPEGAHSCFMTTYSARYHFPRDGGWSPPFYLQPLGPVFVEGIQVLITWYTGARCGGIWWTVGVNGGVVIDDVRLVNENANTFHEVPYVGELSELMLLFRAGVCWWPEIMTIWLACAHGHVPGVVAEFEAIPVSGYVPLTVQFTDLSTLERPEAPAISSWGWSFGDGRDSYDQNPVHTYFECPHKYNVQLTVSNRYQSDSEVKPEYIETMCPEIPEIKVRGETRFLLA